MSKIPKLKCNRTTSEILIEGQLSFFNSMLVLNESLSMMNVLDQSVHIDLSKLRCADTSVIALLIEWHQYAKKHHKKLRILHLSHSILSLLKIICLDEWLPEIYL